MVNRATHSERGSVRHVSSASGGSPKRDGGRPARRPWVAPGGLVVGAVFGVLGTFVPSASVRGLLWGLDGVALIVATALLTIYHCRRGNDVIAAGFLVFVVGETLVLSGAAADLVASGPVFGAGVACGRRHWASSARRTSCRLG